jgi:c-di-GMP-related signal transduction protein
VFEKFIARQPIFDERLKLFAYELLFRAGSENIFTPRKDASSSMIVDSVMLFDLPALTGSAKAFINLDEASLRRGAARLLPPDRVIIEILESVAPSDEVIRLCKELCAAGYVLALDDYIGHAKWDALIPLVKFFKVDFRAANSDTRGEIVQRFQGRGLRFLAEKVETHADLQEARVLGYSFFQGFFFCKPAMVAARDIPGNKLNCLRILEALAPEDFSHEEVETLLKNDPSLIYKLLRYLNSPLLGLRGEVRGVRDAIALLGDNEFRRWVSIVAIVVMAGDKPPELIRTALTRAFFCEAISQPIGIPAQGPDLFLMGLLSVTDALLDRPIDQVLSTLPVSADLRTAVCGGANRFRDVYDTLLAYERADWPAVAGAFARLAQIENAIPDCYQFAATRASALPF